MNNGITKENILFTLPLVLQGDASTGALADATAEVLANRMEEIDRLRIISNIDNLEEELLAILAQDFKVDWWDPNYSLDEKRRTLKSSWYVHKHLGTKAAVEQAISAIYPGTKVEEWFEYGGEPYHFRLQINISDDDIDSERRRRVLDRLYYYKNLRSHNDGIHYFMEPQAAEANACGGHTGSHLRIETGTGLELSGTSPRSQAEAFAGAVSSGRYMFVGTADVPVPGLSPPKAESGVHAAAGSPGTRMRIWSGMELSGTGTRSQAGASAGTASCGYYSSAVVAVKTGGMARPGGTAVSGAARKTVGVYQKITTEVSG